MIATNSNNNDRHVRRLAAITLASALLASCSGGGDGAPGSGVSAGGTTGAGTPAGGTATGSPTTGSTTTGDTTTGGTTTTGTPATGTTSGDTASGGTTATTPTTQSTSLVTQWGTVNEPTLPQTVCATLTATITPAANGSIDAVDADPTRSNPDALRIQDAINACPAGQAVKLVKDAGGASGFLSGPLQIKSGVTLWIDGGVTLYASRNPLDFDNGPGTCGTATTANTDSCKPFILATATTGSGIVGDGSIDGRGGSLLTKGANAGLRSWWDVSWQNKTLGLYQQNFGLIAVKGGTDFTLYRVALLNSPHVHVAPSDVTGLTIWGVKLLTPTLEYANTGYVCPANTTPDKITPATCFTPDTVKNTDGIDPNRVNKLLLAYSYISVGDDHVAVAAHTSATPVTNLSFQHNHLYYGHGMSIGSITDAGLNNMVVDDMTIDGYDSGVGGGLKIKSGAGRGGHIDNVSYSNVCMRNVRYPLDFESYYVAAGGTTMLPWYTNITVRNVHMVGSTKYGGGQLKLTGYEYGGQNFPMTITLDNVVLDGTSTLAAGNNGGPNPALGGAHFTLGPGAVSFSSLLVPSATTDVTVTGTPGTSVPRDCSTAFVPLNSVMPNSPI